MYVCIYIYIEREREYKCTHTHVYTLQISIHKHIYLHICTHTRRHSPCWVMESVVLDSPSVLDPESGRGRGQVVVLPSDHQRGEERRALGPPPAPGCPLGAVSGLLLAEVAVGGRLHPVGGLLHLLSVDDRGREGGLEVVAVEAAVGHGAVEAADGPDADGEGLGLQGAPGIAVAPGLRLQGRSLEADAVRLRLVESPLLPGSHPLAVLPGSACRGGHRVSQPK